MYCSVSGRLTKLPNNQEVSNCAIVPAHSCDSCGLPQDNKIMQVASYEPSMLLKDLAQHIVPQGAAVEHALPQSIQDRQGVHSSGFPFAGFDL
jgi:hypothetical protein